MRENLPGVIIIVLSFSLIVCSIFWMTKEKECENLKQENKVLIELLWRLP